MYMGQNVGMADRIIRIILAVVFIILALAKTPIQSVWWFIPALIALVTGIVGWCGIYALFGWSTCCKEKNEKAVKAKKVAKKRKK